MRPAQLHLTLPVRINKENTKKKGKKLKYVKKRGQCKNYSLLYTTRLIRPPPN